MVWEFVVNWHTKLNLVIYYYNLISEYHIRNLFKKVKNTKTILILITNLQLTYYQLWFLFNIIYYLILILIVI